MPVFKPIICSRFFLRICCIVSLGIVFSFTANIDAQAALVASIRPLGFIAAAIADGVIPVEVMLPDGASPHDYALRPTNALQLKKADLLLWVGAKMETFLTGPASSLPAERCITLADLPSVTTLLPKIGEELYDSHVYDKKCRGGHIHHHGDYNMHLWLSPIIARRIAEAINHRLAELMPEKKTKLDNNLYLFKKHLTINDKNIAKILAPFRAKRYVVFHDAYGYFEKYYGLTPSGYFTANPEIQPGAQALHKIRTQLVEQKVTCIFAEPQFRPAVINAVVRGTSVHIGTLDPMGIGIALNKESYARFLSQLTNQYVSCLEKNI
ncbi:zinc ABC transporter substrate-binding protein ZnuA [Candidatus Moranella endobia]|uniref:High-affinity zinc uptake system protein ZnuA n=1 Tax=Moranella endobia (strain PCIT) TaxID=903503 RepID=F7XXF1_MOREP|nr:zinc ABC transporter substrate-binding protein ZnuA [Candidatus Moranella endobia]AEI74777.1 putative high-affinity zinc transporter periplasmic component [Candidatus Moranella endobia PCIT]